MGIVRLITIAAVIWVVWFLLKRFQEKLAHRREHQQVSRKKSNPVSNIKKCTVCGVHVPESEALEHNGQYFCSLAHKKANLDSRQKPR